MADVTINSGPVEAEDKLRHVPREKWRELMFARRRFLEIKLSHDCRCLVQFVNDAQEMFAELGFASPEAMIIDGYGLEPKEISVAVEWLTLNPPKDPISLERVNALAQHGGDRGNQYTGGKRQGGITTLAPEEKNTVKHILARLDRDGHTLLAAMVRGGKLSANAAAIEVGYRKPTTGLDRLRKAWAKATEDERKRFLAEVQL